MVYQSQFIQFAQYKPSETGFSSLSLVRLWECELWHPYWLTVDKWNYLSLSLFTFNLYVLLLSLGPRCTQACWDMEFLQCVLGLPHISAHLQCARYNPRGRHKEGTPHQLYHLSLFLSNWRRGGTALRSTCITELLTFCLPSHSFGHYPEVLAIGQNEDIQVNWEWYFVPQLSLHTIFKCVKAELTRTINLNSITPKTTN